MKTYYCSNQKRLLSPFCFVTPLLLACFATVLTFAPNPTAARDQVPFNGTVSGSGSIPTVPYSLFPFGAFSKASDLSTLRPPNPVVASAKQIRGAEGTGGCGGGYGLGVGLLDLDHGFGAGATIYDHGGFLWCETCTLSMVRRTWNIDAVRTARRVQPDEKHLRAERNDSGWEQGCRRCNLP